LHLNKSWGLVFSHCLQLNSRSYSCNWLHGGFHSIYFAKEWKWRWNDCSLQL